MKTLMVRCRLELSGAEEDAACLFFIGSPGGLPAERDAGKTWPLLDWSFQFRNGRAVRADHDEKPYKGLYKLVLWPGTTPEQFTEWAKKRSSTVKIAYRGKPLEVEIGDPTQFVEGDFDFDKNKVDAKANGHRGDLEADRV